jgi:phosphoribosylformimino-5-aminoimidazole carboxamide ribotide isomerase
VVGALLALHPFTVLYVADLDALQGRAPQWLLVDRLREAFPALALWIDAGVRDAERLRQLAPRGSAVLAAETMDPVSAGALLAAAPDAVLSLDFRGGRFLGPQTLLDEPSRWPARVIAMELARVGSGEGPDLALIGALRAAAPRAGVYAAGGVRHVDDLNACRAAGARGALVASSLHDGHIGAPELRSLAPA